MATRAAVQAQSPDPSKIIIVTWTGLANGDSGEAVDFDDFPDRSVQVGGTFGTGGTVVIEGSNDLANYISLTDPQGNAISKTAAAIETVMELTRIIRPRVTAGDGTTSINVTMVFRR